jgi:predicted transcriptional regulator
MARKVVKAAPTRSAEIDHLAFRIIKQYQPEALQQPQEFDIERFYENALEKFTGVRPDYQDLGLPVHGYTDSDQQISVVDTALAENPSQRNRFRATVAHEVGHAILHVQQFRKRKELLRFTHDCEDVSLRMYREDEIPAYVNPEWQAWRFAKAILMPEKTFRMAHATGMDLRKLAATFGVSVDFARQRLRDLRL